MDSAIEYGDRDTASEPAGERLVREREAHAALVRRLECAACEQPGER